MPMTRAEQAAWQLARLHRSRGATIVLRATSAGPEGPEPAPHPPRTGGTLELDAAATEGDTTLTLTAPLLQGRFVPGDRLLIAGLPDGVTVATETIAANRVAVVPLLEPVPHAFPRRTAVIAAWVTDLAVRGSINYGMDRLADGRLVQGGDVVVTVSAWRLPRVPDEQWRIMLPGGEEWTIVAVGRVSVDGVPTAYQLQARS